MNIAVLTSGGDAPGMNAAVRAVVRCGIFAGNKVYGVMRGYAGLIADDFVELGLRSVGNIIQKGGTILKTSRCPEFLTKEGFSKAIANLKKRKIDGVVVIGGDGSIKGAEKMMNAGVNVVCLPGTIDNDLYYTDYTIGFDSAVNTIVSLMNNIRDTTEAHDRVCIVEVMGAHSGDIALSSGISSGADIIVCPEVKVDVDEICNKLNKSKKAGKLCSIIMIAEGAGSASWLQNEIRQRILLDARCVVIGHIQRGGSPSRFDREYASLAAEYAIDLFKNKTVGKAVGMVGGKIIDVPIEQALKGKRKFNKKLYDLANTLSI